ncbi:MAG: signal peptidase II [Candidatus Accumulibacter sp.]|nr:signal peptidase II [Accumulibacter sp.]
MTSPERSGGASPDAAGTNSRAASRAAKNRFVVWLCVACAVVLVDQTSKWVALKFLRVGDVIYVAPFFDWVLAFNTGAAFSFLAGAGGWQRWFFIVLSLVASVWIVFLLKHHAPETRFAFALSMVLGGAIGNVVDRVSIGAVVDFIQWHAGGYYWPAFNAADSAITLGALVLVWDQFASEAQGKAK